MNPWKPILAALVIFAAGVITGGLLVNQAERSRPTSSSATSLPAPSATPTEPSPSAGPAPSSTARSSNPPLPSRFARVINDEFIRHLDSEIQLTRGQRERIQDIIAEGQARNQEIWNQISPELRREMLEAQRRIRDLLTPEQRAKFEELLKESRAANRRKAGEATPPADVR